jgi:hypothetical protein
MPLFPLEKLSLAQPVSNHMEQHVLCVASCSGSEVTWTVKVELANQRTRKY